MKVSRYVLPAEFDMWKDRAEKMGFAYVASGPLVRSSYKARRIWYLIDFDTCTKLGVRLANTLLRICCEADPTIKER